jgi:hypothetical protein
MGVVARGRADNRIIAGTNAIAMILLRTRFHTVAVIREELGNASDFYNGYCHGW